MARLEVYRMPVRSGRGYVLDVQADLLASLATRVVAPLLPRDTVRDVASDLNPVFDIEGQPHVMLTQAIAAVPKRELRTFVVSLRDHHDVVLRALDILLTGV